MDSLIISKDYNPLNDTSLFMGELFKNKDAKGCPITKCSLLNQGCSDDLNYELIRMK